MIDTRRVFLKWASAVGGLVTAALAGVPALRAFLSPVFRRELEDSWVRLGDIQLFELGYPTRVDFSQTIHDAWIERRVLKGVWLYTPDGETFVAFNGSCTHLGCGYRYDDENDIFRCPCHNAMFDIQTGEVLSGPPPRPLDKLETRIDGGVLYVRYQEFRLGIEDRIRQ